MKVRTRQQIDAIGCCVCPMTCPAPRLEYERKVSQLCGQKPHAPGETHTGTPEFTFGSGGPPEREGEVMYREIHVESHVTEGAGSENVAVEEFNVTLTRLPQTSPENTVAGVFPCGTVVVNGTFTRVQTEFWSGGEFQHYVTVSNLTMTNQVATVLNVFEQTTNYTVTEYDTDGETVLSETTDTTDAYGFGPTYGLWSGWSPTSAETTLEGGGGDPLAITCRLTLSWEGSGDSVIVEFREPYDDARAAEDFNSSMAGTSPIPFFAGAITGYQPAIVARLETEYFADDGSDNRLVDAAEAECGRYRWALPDGYTKRWVMLEWDVALFPQEYLDYEVAHDEWDGDHAAWITAHAAWVEGGEIGDEPDEPAEPLMPTAPEHQPSRISSESWTYDRDGGSLPYSDWFPTTIPEHHGEVRLVNALEMCWKSEKQGNKPTLFGEAYPFPEEEEP